MRKTSTRVDEDIAALRNDLYRLGADFAEMPNRMRSYSRDKIMRSRKRLRTALLGLEDRAKDRVRDTSSALKDHGHYAVDRCRGEVQHRPLASIGVAFVGGWLLAFLLGRRWH